MVDDDKFSNARFRSRWLFAVAVASNVPSMLLFSYMWRPSSIGGLSCSPGNFSAPSVVSSCLKGVDDARVGGP